MHISEAIGTLLCRNILKCKDLPVLLEWLEIPYIPHHEQGMNSLLEMQIVRESYSFQNLSWGQQSNWPEHPEHRQGEIRMIWAHVATFLSITQQAEVLLELIKAEKGLDTGRPGM